MKRTTSLILIMVMMLSILGGCRKVNDTESNLSTVSDINIEQLENSSETDTSENEESSDLTEENSTTSSQNSTSTTTSNNSKPSKKPSSSNSSTTSSVATNPSTSNSSTDNNSNTSTTNSNSNSNWLDGYVYKDPTIYVDGMYTRETAKNIPNRKRIRMGELYVDRNYVAQIHLDFDYDLNIGNEFDTNHIVTDVNKMPSNYQLYPYVIDTIPNWLYEKNITIDNCKGATPIECYAFCPLGQYMENIILFYRSIGNIDYNNNMNVDVNIMHDSILHCIADPYNEDPINMDKLTEYVNYIKNNNIKMTIKAEPLLPIIYNKTGRDYLLRTKVTVNVENSNTDNIKLFLHDNLTLKKGENVFYIDVPMTFTSALSYNAKVDVFDEDISQYIIA